MKTTIMLKNNVEIKKNLLENSGLLIEDRFIFSSGASILFLYPLPVYQNIDCFAAILVLKFILQKDVHHDPLNFCGKIMGYNLQE